MKQELQQRLFTNYPELWGNMAIIPGQPRMPISFGIECGDGWFDIIDGICAGLVGQRKQLVNSVTLARKHKWDTTAELENKLGAQVPAPSIAQIKEKFGTLRFYIDGGTEADHAVIEFGERMSAVTCEECGNKGAQTSTGWIRTLCDPCNLERLEAEKKADEEWNAKVSARAGKIANALDSME